MKELVVILHNIRSIHNVGSMFRTADGAGVGKIYLTGITPAPTDRMGRPVQAFSKVSLGAQNSVVWEKVYSISHLIKKLKKDGSTGSPQGGYTIVAVEQAKNSVSYYKFKPKHNTKIALIMGNEVKGIAQSVLKTADVILEIPMRGKKESLNVGVSFGIVVYALTAERK